MGYVDWMRWLDVEDKQSDDAGFGSGECVLSGHPSRGGLDAETNRCQSEYTGFDSRNSFVGGMKAFRVMPQSENAGFDLGSWAKG